MEEQNDKRQPWKPIYNVQAGGYVMTVDPLEQWRWETARAIFVDLLKAELPTDMALKLAGNAPQAAVKYADELIRALQANEVKLGEIAQ